MRREWLARGCHSVACVLVLACGSVAPAGAADDDPNTRAMKELTSWFAGEWDNDEQLWFEADYRKSVPAADRHRRLHATHTRVPVPALGPVVFLIEEYADDDRAKIADRSLLTFLSDRSSGTLRSRRYSLRDPERLLVGPDLAARLAALAPDDVVLRGGCDIVWRRDAGQYSGAVESRSCPAGPAEHPLGAPMGLRLSADHYWRTTRAARPEAARGATAGGLAEPYRLRRAHRFSCVLNFTTDYLRGPQPADEQFRNLPLHTQGGEFTVVRASTGQRYTVRLRHHEYPYYDEHSDFMFLAVRETGKPFIAYSLHDPDARLIGLNLNWMNLVCDRAPIDARGDNKRDSGESW